MPQLLATFLAIFLGLKVFLNAAPEIQRNSRFLLDAPNAYQVQQFTQAASTYLSAPATFTAVLASAAGGNVQISAATLQAAGALDPSFVNANGYGQSFAVIVHEYSATQLQALVITCGGTTIPDVNTRHLVQLAGGPIKGGGIPAVGIYSTNTTVAVGGNGGLSVSLAIFAGTACTLSAGHIGAALFLDGSQILPPYLFTSLVPGAGAGPNTMNTTLYMAAGQDIYSNSKQRYMTQSVQDVFEGGDGLVVTKPTCPVGTPQIFVTPAVVSASGNGLPLIGFEAYAVDNGTTWTAHLAVTSQNSAGTGNTQVNPSSSYGQLVAFAKCT